MTGAEMRAGRRWRKILIGAIIALGNLHRRVLAAVFGVVGPRLSYQFSAAMARWLYRLLDPLRIRCEGQCRAALGSLVPAEEIARLAEQAFVHRVWNLTDLMLADRLLHANTYRRYGGRIDQPYLGQLLRAQRRGQALILLTAYYGPFDLLPIFLGYNGICAAVVYRRHSNAAFDEYRRRIRGRSGCELIPLANAPQRVEQILAGGGTVAMVADHYAQKGGMPATFLGLPTRAMRSVGLLAWRYDADVVVSGIRRVGEPFRFKIVVTDIVKHAQWQERDDPVTYITQRYLRGLEKLILADPSQYVWLHARWGEEFAARLYQGDWSC